MEMLKETTDKEEKTILEEEVNSLREKKEELKQSTIDLLIPPDSFDDVSEIYLEFRAGAGGSESAVFV
jgi:peptide chain release factor 1